MGTEPTEDNTATEPGAGLEERETAASWDVDPALADRSILSVVRKRLSRESLKRNTTLWALFGLATIPFWGYVIWMAYLRGQLLGSPSRAQFGAGFLGGVIVLYVLYELIQLVDGGERFIWSDVKALFGRENVLNTLVLLACVIIIIPTIVFVYTEWQTLTSGFGRRTRNEYIMALTFTIVVAYITWRAFGTTFLAVLLVGIGYGLYGGVIPGPLGHTGISHTRMLRVLALTMEGFFGFLTQLTAAWIALFLLYAGMLKAFGAFDLILRVAVRSAKYLDSGVAQTAVLSSAVIGSVNGSQTANVGMTGSFTIPIMKRSGVKPATAGGVESVASTSGQVLPPVMGAGAFVMATLVPGASYIDVIVAGLIPAAILMITIVVAVHYAAAPQIEDPDMDDIFEGSLSQLEVVLESIKFGIPLLILIYLLGIAQYTIMTSAVWTIAAMVALGTTIPTLKQLYETSSIRLTFWTFVDTVDQTYNGFREGAIVLAPVAIILASINGVVDIFLATGVPTSLSLTLIQISGGVLLLAAIMSAIICILLGLGMPTTASYTIVALLIAPTLINDFMLPDFAGHFFVFYAAILAGLTPPIATCVAVATGIAGSNFWQTCYESIKISAPLFILPFSFVYYPDIVDHGGAVTSEIFLVSAVILAGGLMIIHGLNYRFEGSTPIVGATRLAFVVLGIVVMVHGDLMVRLGALGIAVLLYLTQAAVGEDTPLTKLRSVASAFNGRRGS